MKLGFYLSSPALSEHALLGFRYKVAEEILAKTCRDATGEHKWKIKVIFNIHSVFCFMYETRNAFC